MSKIQLPPKRNQSDAQEDKPAAKISEKKIQDIINKGGSPTKSAEPVTTDRVKNFNLSVLESDLDIIGKLCNQRPKKPGRVIAFSKKDWLLEAVQEKIERERKKYKL